MQANVEQQTLPQDNQLDPNLNLESEAAQIRNNINQFENVNVPQNKFTEPIKTNKLVNPPDTDFQNPDGTFDWKLMAMYYKGLANLMNAPNADFKNPDGTFDWKSIAMYYKGVASSNPPKTSKPKGNYGKLDPPSFVENPELPNCAYYEWKQLFLEFMQNNYMEDWEGVSFLKSKCLPQHHQQAISNLRDTTTIFALLDTQYGSKVLK